MADPETPSEPDEELDAEEYGTLTAEDADAETVDPADVAGTADEDDDAPPAH